MRPQAVPRAPAAPALAPPARAAAPAARSPPVCSNTAGASSSPSPAIDGLARREKASRAAASSAASARAARLASSLRRPGVRPSAARADMAIRRRTRPKRGLALDGSSKLGCPAASMVFTAGSSRRPRNGLTCARHHACGCWPCQQAPSARCRASGASARSPPGRRHDARSQGGSPRQPWRASPEGHSAPPGQRPGCRWRAWVRVQRSTACGTPREMHQRPTVSASSAEPWPQAVVDRRGKKRRAVLRGGILPSRGEMQERHGIGPAGHREKESGRIAARSRHRIQECERLGIVERSVRRAPGHGDSTPFSNYRAWASRSTEALTSAEASGYFRLISASVAQACSGWPMPRRDRDSFSMLSGASRELPKVL